MVACYRVPTVNAVFSYGAGFLPTVWTIHYLGSYFSVNRSISSIDFEDFGLEVLICKTEMISKEFPHCLAGECEFFDVLFIVIFTC